MYPLLSSLCVSAVNQTTSRVNRIAFYVGSTQQDLSQAAHLWGWYILQNS